MRSAAIRLAVLVAVAAAALALTPTVSPAASGRYRSLDVLTLCSERIALVRVTSYRDSTISEYYTDRQVRFAVERTLPAEADRRVPSRSV